MKSPTFLSIVVPCHNEEEVLFSTHHTLRGFCDAWLLRGLIRDYELVFVNNGSGDKTLDVMLDIYNRDTHAVIVDLRKNFGVQGSFSAGLFEATGDVVVTIDADLQDDASKIEDMIQKYYEGYEMVLGVRMNRDSDTFFKRITAQAFYKTLKMMGIQSVYNHADFRLLSRALVVELKKFPERVRYLRGLIFEIESRYACVYYSRQKRKLGKSKFNVFSLFTLAFDGITSFTSTPIRLISIMGFAMFLFSLFGFIYVFYSKFILFRDVPGWASLALIILFFGGIQNLALGIIGEYIAKMYLETKRRPIYIVKKEYRHNTYT